MDYIKKIHSSLNEYISFTLYTLIGLFFIGVISQIDYATIRFSRIVNGLLIVSVISLVVYFVVISTIGCKELMKYIRRVVFIYYSDFLYCIKSSSRKEKQYGHHTQEVSLKDLCVFRC